MISEVEHTVLGMMSGTSCDGLDLALCRFVARGEVWHYQLLQATTIDYGAEMRTKLSTAHTFSASDLMQFDREFGHYMGHQANQFIAQFGVDVDLICSHGHTVFHSPKDGYTLQIGHGANIAATTGIATVCDLRSTDVALGGQGAPLVPMGDALLFSEYDICLNLGGFANLSYRDGGRIEAFDICPVNLPMNALCEQLGQRFDRDGTLAASNTINHNLFTKLLAAHGSGRPSLSREWVEANFWQPLRASGLSVEDQIATVAAYAAQKIASTLNELPGQTVLATGGGAHNLHLLAMIRASCNKQIHVPDEATVNFKEAIVWAFLGLLRTLEKPNISNSYTGGTRPSVAGAVYLGAG